MDSLSSAVIASANTTNLGSVQGAASVSILKKALNAQALGVARLVESVAQPELATTGTIGTRVNTFA